MPRNKRVTIKLYGQHVSLKSLVEAAGNMEKCLEELDRSCTGSKTIEWDVVNLSLGSAEVAVEPRTIVSQVIDVPVRIVRQFKEGIEGISSERMPDNYPEKAWGFLCRTMSVIDNGIDKVFLSVAEDEQTETHIEIDHSVISEDAEDILEKIRTSYGSVEGRAKLLNGFQDSFDIADRVTGRRIRCHCSKEILSEIAGHDWEQCVIVTGEITEDANGNPKSVRVDRYRPLSRGPLPQAEDLLGLYVVGNNA